MCGLTSGLRLNGSTGHHRLWHYDEFFRVSVQASISTTARRPRREASASPRGCARASKAKAEPTLVVELPRDQPRDDASVTRGAGKADAPPNAYSSSSPHAAEMLAEAATRTSSRTLVRSWS